MAEKLKDGTYNKILFDNQEDSYQMEFVADENPEVVRQLSKELRGWLKKTNDPYADQFITALN